MSPGRWTSRLWRTQFFCAHVIRDVFAAHYISHIWLIWKDSVMFVLSIIKVCFCGQSIQPDLIHPRTRFPSRPQTSASPQRKPLSTRLTRNTRTECCMTSDCVSVCSTLLRPAREKCAMEMDFSGTKVCLSFSMIVRSPTSYSQIPLGRV